jgi:hypothetical protein
MVVLWCLNGPAPMGMASRTGTGRSSKPTGPNDSAICFHELRKFVANVRSSTRGQMEESVVCRGSGVNDATCV